MEANPSLWGYKYEKIVENVMEMVKVGSENSTGVDYG